MKSGDVHGAMRSRRDERLRNIHNQAGMVTTDGMPLVWRVPASCNRKQRKEIAA